MRTSHHQMWLSSKEEPSGLWATGPDDFTACAWEGSNSHGDVSRPCNDVLAVTAFTPIS